MAFVPLRSYLSTTGFAPNTFISHLCIAANVPPEEAREVEPPKPKQSSRFPVKPSQAPLKFSSLSDAPNTPTTPDSADAVLQELEKRTPGFRPALPQRDTFDLLRMDEDSMSSPSLTVPDSVQTQSNVPILQKTKDNLNDVPLRWDAASNRLVLDIVKEQSETNNTGYTHKFKTHTQLRKPGDSDKTSESLAPPSPFWKPRTSPSQSHWRSHSDSATTARSSNMDLNQTRGEPLRPRSFLGVPGSEDAKAKRNSMGSLWSVVSFPDDL